MEIKKYNEMMKWLTRPKDNFTPEKKKQIAKDFYKKAELPKSKPMPILDYISIINKLYANSEDPGYIEPKEMEDIKKQLQVSPMVKKPKKQSWKYTNWLDEAKPTEEKKQNLLYDIGKKDFRDTNDPDYPNEASPSQLAELETRLKNARAFTSKPKKIIKKTLTVEKPKTKPVPISPLPYDWRIGDWLDPLDEDAPIPPPEDIEKVLNIKKREVAGLEALMKLHNKRYG